MRNQYDVLIIGGGIFGSAIFYYLLKNTRLKVALLEKHQFAYGATGSSGGMLRTLHTDASLAQLALEGLNAFKNYEKEIGISCGFKQTGFYTIINQEQLPLYQDAIQLMKMLKVKIQCYSSAEIKKMMPNYSLQLQANEMVIVESDSGYAEPKLANTGYLISGRNLGGLTAEQVDVQEIHCKNAQVVGIKTSWETFMAPCVVVAAGAWTSQLLNSSGINFPGLTTHAIQVNYYQHSTAMVIDPFLDKALGIYGRHLDKRHFLLGIAQLSPIGNPDSDKYLNKREAESLFSLASLRIPEWRDAQWCGGRRAYDAYTKNNFGINQFVPEVSGLFVCSGWSGIGFKFAPPCANAAAKSIADFFSLGEKYRVNDEKIC